jgi:hypothetical protein
MTLIDMFALSGRMDFAPAWSGTKDRVPLLCSMPVHEIRRNRLVRAIRTKRFRDWVGCIVCI